MKPSRATARTIARTVRQSKAERFFGSERRTAARRLDRAKTMSISAKVRQDDGAPTARSYPVLGPENPILAPGPVEIVPAGYAR
jgi:hypothetical protein